MFTGSNKDITRVTRGRCDKKVKKPCSKTNTTRASNRIRTENRYLPFIFAKPQPQKLGAGDPSLKRCYYEALNRSR